MDINSMPAFVSSAVGEAPSEKIESPGLCTRIACGTANCVKRFGLGVASAGIGTPISFGAAYLAGKVGLIREVGDQASLLKEQIDNMKKLGFKIDRNAIANAKCKMQAFVDQINSNVRGDKTSVFAIISTLQLLVA